MLQCTFELNDKPLSNIKIGALSVPAFSGMDGYVNKRSCVPKRGAIPPGRYYIFDRQSGGRLGAVRDWIGGQLRGSGINEWYALYSIDGKIDDITICDGIQRGAFRLHPKGHGISQGCIAIESLNDWHHIRAIFGGTARNPVQGTSLSAYGVLTVQ
ncbi:conserved hypothetical protein [Burkholderia sp. H160]|nr:conserved hypothetical protein [Burkholderia sp. H160]